MTKVNKSQFTEEPVLGVFTPRNTPKNSTFPCALNASSVNCGLFTSVTPHSRRCRAMFALKRGEGRCVVSLRSWSKRVKSAPIGSPSSSAGSGGSTLALSLPLLDPALSSSADAGEADEDEEGVFF